LMPIMFAIEFLWSYWLFRSWILKLADSYVKKYYHHARNAWFRDLASTRFRTNTAYDRWWEGRKCGCISNSRNFAIKLSAILHDEKIANTFEKWFPVMLPFYIII
jgi:putative membrane protein